MPDIFVHVYKVCHQSRSFQICVRTNRVRLQPKQTLAGSQAEELHLGFVQPNCGTASRSASKSDRAGLTVCLKPAHSARRPDHASSSVTVIWPSSANK